MAGRIGLTPQEIVEEWNGSLRSLNSKLAPIEAPAGVDVQALERNPSVVRVPDVKQQSMYSVLIDVSATIMAIVDQNNQRIAEQLRAAGVDDLPDTS